MVETDKKIKPVITVMFRQTEGVGGSHSQAQHLRLNIHEPVSQSGLHRRHTDPDSPINL